MSDMSEAIPAQSELEMAERVVAGTLVGRWPPDGNLPPALSRLVKHAPDSFRDLRLGKIVAACRRLADANRPVHSQAINIALGPEDEAGSMLWEVERDALLISTAEAEAGPVWRAFRARHLARALADGVQLLTTRPAAFDQVRAKLDQSFALFSVGPGESLKDRVHQRMFHPSHPPPHLPARYLVNGITIATPGNLTAISAALKAGKSAFIGGMMASVLAGDAGHDCLGVTSANPGGLALLHFDTEQSPSDHHALVTRVWHRARVATPPNWLQSYCLTGFSYADARQAVLLTVEEAASQFGGIHSVLIDGVADLVSDVNDPVESASLVSELHALAISHQCPVIGVLHVNPGTEKTRGHLGSQLERKAESNLRLEKSAGISVVWSDKNRGAPIPKERGPRFCWSDADGMHVRTATLSATKADTKRTDLRDLAEAVLEESGSSSLAWKAFIEGIHTTAKLTERTARSRFDQMRNLGVLRKDTLHRWTLA